MPSKQTLFILCGEAFSGKSTLAKNIADQYGARIVGRDALYFAIEKTFALEQTPEEDDDTLWENLWPIVTQGVKNHLLIGNSVVVDDTCLYVRQRDTLRSIAQKAGVPSILVYLDIPTETLQRRKEENKITKSRHDVPSSWLEEDAILFERPTERENPVIYRPDLALDDLFKNSEI